MPHWIINKWKICVRKLVKETSFKGKINLKISLKMKTGSDETIFQKQDVIVIMNFVSSQAFSWHLHFLVVQIFMVFHKN